MTRMSNCAAALRVVLAVCLSGILTAGSSAEDESPADPFATALSPPQQAAVALLPADARKLEKQLRVLFPDSRVQLRSMPDRLEVSGHAASAEEQARILQIVRSAVCGPGAGRCNDTIDNMLQVPGKSQIILHVKVVDVKPDQLKTLSAAVQTLGDARQLPGGGFTGVFENQQVERLIKSLTEDETVVVKAAPTLKVLSGHQASFLSGGEFPVPSITGVGGEFQTSYRGVGTSLLVQPETINKDRIKLELTPEFSTLSKEGELTTRRIQTAVTLKEGQTVLLTLGLIEERAIASETRVPILGDLPAIGPAFRTRRTRKENDACLLLVTPELLKPVGCDDVWLTHSFCWQDLDDSASNVYPTVTREPAPRNPKIPSPYYLTDDVQYFPPSLTMQLQVAGSSPAPAPSPDATIYPNPQPAQFPGGGEDFPHAIVPVSAEVSAPNSGRWETGQFPEPPAVNPQWWAAEADNARIAHMRRAAAELQSAGLLEHVLLVEREIAKEQLRIKQQEIEKLERQVRHLRHSIAVPPLPERPFPTAPAETD